MLACGVLEPELERVADLPDVDVVTVDLRGLEFLDSHGLRALLFARTGSRSSTAGWCSCAARTRFSACSRSRA